MGCIIDNSWRSAQMETFMSLKPRKIGKYELGSKIGSGGMAVVYQAHDVELGRQVALKLINHVLEDTDTIRKRFLNEANVAVSLNHPNIIFVYDLGVEGDRLYMAMEYLPGRDLNEIIEDKIPLSVKQKIQIVLQTAKALQHAHGRGVIHRDIKPSNIRIVDGGGIKLMDFGIAKLLSRELTRLTSTGSAMGSPSYMSPEQILGEEITPASDVFGFGIVLYELLTYRKPFTGPTPVSRAYKIVNEPPEPIVEDVPDGLRKLIDACLAKSVEDRFHSFDPVIDELLVLQQYYRSKSDDDAVEATSIGIPLFPPGHPSAEPTDIDATTPDGDAVHVDTRRLTPEEGVSRNPRELLAETTPARTLPGKKARAPGERSGSGRRQRSRTDRQESGDSNTRGLSGSRKVRSSYGTILIVAVVALLSIGALLTLLPPDETSSSHDSNGEKQRTLHLASGSVAKLVWIPSGTYWRGCVPADRDCAASESPSHQVYVDSFWIGRTEVTQAQWAAVMGSNPSQHGGDNFPVEKVSWLDVRKFLAKVGRGVRLPTEAEWEYAARGGLGGLIYPWGDHPQDGSRANSCDARCGEKWKEPAYDDGFATTAPVGSFPPNGYGLLDMAGNVYEWCADPYDKNAYDGFEDKIAKNPVSSGEDPSVHVVKGGAWSLGSVYLRSSYRFGIDEKVRRSFIGFRIALSAGD